MREPGDGAASATHHATQSEQCPPEPKASGHTALVPGSTHRAVVPVAHVGAATHACQQYTSPSAHDASSASERRLDETPPSTADSSLSQPHATAAAAALPSASSLVNAAAARRRHSPNVIDSSAPFLSFLSFPPEFPETGLGVSGDGKTIRPNHARESPTFISRSDISCVGTAMAPACDLDGNQARAPSPSITSTASGGSAGDLPPSVSPRGPEASSSVNSLNRSVNSESGTRSAGVMTMATPTSVCSPLPRSPGVVASRAVSRT